MNKYWGINSYALLRPKRIEAYGDRGLDRPAFESREEVDAFIKALQEERDRVWPKSS